MGMTPMTSPAGKTPCRALGSSPHGERPDLLAGEDDKETIANKLNLRVLNRWSPRPISNGRAWKWTYIIMGRSLPFQLTLAWTSTWGYGAGRLCCPIKGTRMGCSILSQILVSRENRKGVNCSKFDAENAPLVEKINWSIDHRQKQLPNSKRATGPSHSDLDGDSLRRRRAGYSFVMPGATHGPK
jgi:hypothetical protein